jgi:hypothetical protein
MEDVRLIAARAKTVNGFPKDELENVENPWEFDRLGGGSDVSSQHQAIAFICHAALCIRSAYSERECEDAGHRHVGRRREVL